MDHNGSLSEIEKEQLKRTTVRDYTMPDGTVVKIDPTKPLPAAVKAVITEQAAPVAAEFTSADISVLNPAIEDMRSFAWSKADEIGKPLVIVWRGPSALAGGGSETIWRSVPSGVKSTGLPGEYTKDAMVARAKQWGDPRGYEVIAVGDGHAPARQLADTMAVTSIDVDLDRNVMLDGRPSRDLV